MPKEKIYVECTCGFTGITYSDDIIEADGDELDNELELETEKEVCPRCMREIIPITDEDKMREIDEISFGNRKKGIETYTNEDSD